MRKILKSTDLNIAEDPVVIPDTIIYKSNIQEETNNIDDAAIDFSVYNEDDVQKLKDYFEQRSKAMLASVNAEINRLENRASEIISNANLKADEIVKKATENADDIISDAEIKAADIIKNANAKADNIYIEAEKKGIEKGKRDKVNEIDECFNQVFDLMKQLKNYQLEQFNDIAPQLKYLALDIVEKIVYKKISDDDTYLSELVVQSIKNLKDPEWITVEISEKMSGLITYLINQQNIGLVSKNAEFHATATDVGNIKIESQSSICDISIITQLQNIKNYFDNYGDDENEIQQRDSSTST